MPKNERISELFDQEFNKEKNYQAIMQKFDEYKKTHDLEEERRKYKRNLYFKVTASSLAVILIVVVSIVLINQNPSGPIEFEGDGNTTQTEVEDKIVVNDFSDTKANKIDIVWSDNAREHPNIDNTVFTKYNAFHFEDLSFVDSEVYGSYQADQIIEFVLTYNQIENERKHIIIDICLNEFNPNYIRFKYDNELVNELDISESSFINKQKVKILKLNEYFFVTFEKNNLKFDVAVDTSSIDVVKEVVQRILNQ